MLLMMKDIIALLLLTGFSVALSRTAVKFDYFMLVQEWPQTLCQAAKVDDKCKVPVNTTGWVIHGLWPTLMGTEGPTYCNPLAKFNWQAIKNLTGQLAEVWPNCYTSTLFWSLWEHEYLKHGTCCDGVSGVQTEYDYFSKTLELYNEHNMGNILGPGNVKPTNSTSYKASFILSTVQHATSTVPLLYCYYDEVVRMQFLQQIILCMRKDFTLMDCPEEPHSECYEDEPVYYPLKYNS